VLAGGLYFLLRKPASKALGARIEGIEKQLKDLEARKQAAENELVAYNEKIARLDQEAGKILAEYERQGQEARARILEQAKVAAVKLEEQAKRNIDYEMKSARERLQAEIIEKALTKAESRLRERITAADQDRLIDEYLAKVVAS
jgi:F-type H+-transporting ATPase subunit b